MENENIKYYGLCFDWIYSLKDINDPEQRKKYKFQFASFLKKQGISYDAIYEFMMLKGLIDDKPEGMEKKEYLHRLFDSGMEYDECYFYYSEFNKDRILCRVCPHCKFDTNKFAKEEKEMLISCLMRPSLAEKIAESQKQGPIFNSVITDSFYEKSDKTCMPACILLLSRMIFNKMIVGGMNEEEFLNSITNDYGDVDTAKQCAKDYLNMLNIEKSQLSKPPLTNAKIIAYCNHIHEDFGEKNLFPPLGIIKKKRKRATPQVAIRDAFPAIDEAVKSNESATAKTKKTVKKEKANKENKDKIVAKIVPENTRKGDSGVSGKGLKNKLNNVEKKLTSKEKVKKTKSEQTIEVEKFTSKKEPAENNFEKTKVEKIEKNETTSSSVDEKAEIKNINPVSFAFEHIIGGNDLRNMNYVKHKDKAFEQMENEMVNNKYICCDVFRASQGNVLIVFYVDSSKKYYFMDVQNNEVFVPMLRYFRSNNFEIYTSIPWALCCLIYELHNVVATNVFSVYRFASVLNSRDKLLLSDSINDLCKHKECSENLDLFYLSLYGEYMREARERCYEKDLMGYIKEISNNDILYGISMNYDTITHNDNLLRLTPEGKIKYYDEPIENETNNGISFELMFNVVGKNVPTTAAEVCRKVIDEYVSSGNLKKCIPQILRVGDNCCCIHVRNKNEYDYVYDMFSFYGRRISIKLGVHLQMNSKMFK